MITEASEIKQWGAHSPIDQNPQFSLYRDNRCGGRRSRAVLVSTVVVSGAGVVVDAVDVPRNYVRHRKSWQDMKQRQKQPNVLATMNWLPIFCMGLSLI